MIQWYAVILWCGVAVLQVNFKRSDHLVWSLLACSFSFSHHLFNILLEAIGSVQNVGVFA